MGPERVGGLVDARDIRRPGVVVTERVGVATALSVEPLTQDLGVACVLGGLGHDPDDQAAEGGVARALLPPADVGSVSSGTASIEASEFRQLWW